MLAWGISERFLPEFSFFLSAAGGIDEYIIIISYISTAHTQKHSRRKYRTELREGLFSLEEL